MKKRMLGRAAYAEYLLLHDETAAPPAFSLLAAPDALWRASFDRELAARRGRPLPQDAPLPPSSPAPAEEELLAPARVALASLAYLTEPRPSLPRTRDERELLADRLAGAQGSLAAIDAAAAALGARVTQLRREADRAEEQITELTLALEAGRLDLLDALAAALPDDEAEAVCPPPPLEAVFPGELLAVREELAAADRRRAALLARLEEERDVLARLLPLSVALADAARSTLPAALGRICMAAGLLDPVAAGGLPFPAAVSALADEVGRLGALLAPAHAENGK